MIKDGMRYRRVLIQVETWTEVPEPQPQPPTEAEIAQTGAFGLIGCLGEAAKNFRVLSAVVLPELGAWSGENPVVTVEQVFPKPSQP
jgi:hypothetical protein